MSHIDFSAIRLPENFVREPRSERGNSPVDQFNLLVDALRGQDGFKHEEGKFIQCKCPAHAGKGVKSLRVDLKDGKCLIHCHSKCDPADVLKQIGLDWKKLFGGTGEQTERLRGFALSSFAPVPGKSPDRFVYKTGDGAECMRVCRTGTGKNKIVWQEVPDGKGKWRKKTPNDQPVFAPYLSDEIKQLPVGEPVAWVEGEKCVHALRSVGIAATTTAQGSRSFAKTKPELVMQTIAGRDVVIIPDLDEPGESYALDVFQAIRDVAKSVVILKLPNEINGQQINDASDAVAAGWDIDCFKNAEFISCDEWQSEESALDGITKKMQPFPTDVFPPEIENFVLDSAAILSVDPAFVAVPLCSVAGAAIGTKRFVNPSGNWEINAAIWAVLIANSGSNKSSGPKLMVKPLFKITQRRLAEYSRQMDEWDAIVAKCNGETIRERELEAISLGNEKPIPPKQIVIDNTTIEAVHEVLSINPDGVIVACDELSGWIGNLEKYDKTGTDRNEYMKMKDGSPIVVNRKKFGGKPLVIEHSFLSVCGTIQPKTAGTIFKSDLWTSGLVPRMVVASPPKMKRRLYRDDMEIPGYQTYCDMLEWLAESMPGKEGHKPSKAQWVRMRLTDEAFDLFQKDHDDRDDRSTKLGNNPKAALLSKLLGVPAQWAMIRHLMRAALNGDPNATFELIGREDIEAGIKLTRWFEDEADRAFGLVAEASGNDEMLNVWMYLEACENGTRPSDLSKKFTKFFPETRDAEKWLNNNNDKIESKPTKGKRKTTVRYFMRRPK